MSSFSPPINAEDLFTSIAENPDPRARARALDFSVYADIPGFNLLPTNVKAYLQSQLGLGGVGGPITELDMTEKELAELDRIMFEQGTTDPTKIDYTDYGVDLGKVTRPGIMQTYVDTYNKENPNSPPITAQSITENPDNFRVRAPNGEMMTFQELYNKYGDNVMTPQGITPADFLNPAFNLMTFLGQADYSIDENGNIIINDVFDFTKKTDGNDVDAAQGLGNNPLYEIARKFPNVNPLATDIPVEINMGTREDYEARKKAAEEVGMANGGMPLIELKYDL
tara:strand:- start:876 stop:1721 length:846 start_codon:yes stop_codon:yes gene_type:complete